MEFEYIISAVSAIAALLSALWASISYRMAKQALEIASRERGAKESNIDIYLEQIFLTINKEKNNFILSKLIFTNKSEVSDSITRIELIVGYLVNNIQTNIVIGAKHQDLNFKTISNINVTVPPFSIAPRGSHGCWVCFEMPNRVTQSKRINSYKIEALFASGAEVSVEPRLVAELFDE